MPRTFTHEEYADMVYVNGYCNGNANAAVDEYGRRYPLRRTPNRAVLTNVFCALGECRTLPSVHVSSERRSIQTVEEQEEIVSMVHTTEPDYQHTSESLTSPCSTKPRVANIALRWLVSISPSASTTSAPR